VVHRIRLIEPISADFAVLVGDAIHNLQSSLNQVAHQLAVQRHGPLTEDAERRTKLPIRISGAPFDDWATSKNEAAPLGDLREAAFPDDSLGTAVRVRRAAEAISGRSRGRRWQIAGG